MHILPNPQSCHTQTSINYGGISSAGRGGAEVTRVGREMGGNGEE